jgi:hypothetical protein
MTKDAIKKIRLAGKYFNEGLHEFLPKDIRDNVYCIEKDVKEIFTATFGKVASNIYDAFTEDVSTAAKKDETTEEDDDDEEKKVKEVEIE